MPARWVSPWGLSLSLQRSVSCRNCLFLFLTCAWMSCVRESEHLSRKLSSVVAKNSAGASAHMSSDKATDVKEPRYHSETAISCTVSPQSLPSPSRARTFFQDKGSERWKIILLLHGNLCSAVVQKFTLWIKLSRMNISKSTCIWFKINELTIIYWFNSAEVIVTHSTIVNVLGTVLFTYTNVIRCNRGVSRFSDCEKSSDLILIHSLLITLLQNSLQINGW